MKSQRAKSRPRSAGLTRERRSSSSHTGQNGLTSTRKCAQVQLRKRSSSNPRLSKLSSSTSTESRELKTDFVKELVEYYRDRIEAMLEDKDFVQSRLDQFVEALTSREKLVHELSCRESELTELQKTLSDMQVHLFQEREHVLRLYAEVDRLKLRELEDKLKIEQLLQLAGLNSAEITRFFNESSSSESVCKPRKGTNTRGAAFSQLPPDQKVSKNRVNDQLTNANRSEKLPSDYLNAPCLENEVLRRELEVSKATITSLRTQLMEQKQTAQERIASLMDDRRMLQEANATIHKRYEDKLGAIQEELKRSHSMLIECTRSFLAKRNEYQKWEKIWLQGQTTSPPRPSSALAKFRDPKTIDAGDCMSVDERPCSSYGHVSNQHSVHHVRKPVEKLEEQLRQQKKLSELYRDQVIRLEKELDSLRSAREFEESSSNQQVDKLRARLRALNSRYQESERRRRLEAEGYRADISALKKKLQLVEKHLLQFAFSSEDHDPAFDGNIDIALLKEIENSTKNSVKLMDQLKSLKLKMYSLEDDIRKL